MQSARGVFDVSATSTLHDTSSFDASAAARRPSPTADLSVAFHHGRLGSDADVSARSTRPSPMPFTTATNVNRSASQISAQTNVSVAPGVNHEQLLLQAQQQVRELLPFKERALHLQTEILLLQDRFKAKENECESLQAMLRRERADRDSAFAEVERLRESETTRWKNEAERSAKALESQLRTSEELASRLETATSALSRVQHDRDEQAHNAAAVAEDARSKLQQLESVARQYAMVEASLTEAKRRAEDAERRVKDLESETDMLRRRHTELQLHMTSTLQAKQDLQDRLAETERQSALIGALRKDSAELSTTREELARYKAQMQEAADELNDMRSLRREADGVTERLTKRNVTLEAELERVREEKAQLEMRLASLTHVEDNLTTATRQHLQDRDELIRLRHELQDARDDAAAAERDAKLTLAELATEASAMWRHAESTAQQIASPVQVDALDVSSAMFGSPVKLLNQLQQDSATPSHGPSKDLVRQAMFGPVRSVVDRLARGVRAERQRAVEAHRAELEMRGRVARMEEELREAVFHATQHNLARQKAEQELNRTREAAEDNGASARARRREHLTFLRRIATALTNHSLPRDESPSRHIATPSPVALLHLLEETTHSGHTAADSHDVSQTPSAALASAEAELERQVISVAETCTALHHERERLGAQVDALQRELGAARIKWTDELQSTQARSLQMNDDHAREVATLKDSLTRAVVRGDDATRERAATAQELDATRTSLRSSEGRVVELSARVDSLERNVMESEKVVATLRGEATTLREVNQQLLEQCESSAAQIRRLTQQRHDLHVMLGCATAAVLRLRRDLSEVLMQRRLLVAWSRELEHCQHQVDACARELSAETSDDGHHHRKLLRRGGAARFRVAVLAVWSAVRLARCIAPAAFYTSPSSPNGRGREASPTRAAVTTRSRFRPMLRGHAVKGSLLTNVAIAASAVPLPQIDDVLATVHVHANGVVADTVVEQLLAVFTATPHFRHNGNDAALLAQLTGTDLDFTVLRRLATGLCNLPTTSSPMQRCRYACAAMKETTRAATQRALTAERRVKGLSESVDQLKRQLVESDARAAEYARRMGEQTSRAAVQDSRLAAEHASARHDQALAAAAAHAEKKRVESAIAELAKREAIVREARLKLQAEQQLAATTAALTSSRLSLESSRVPSPLPPQTLPPGSYLDVPPSTSRSRTSSPAGRVVTTSPQANLRHRLSVDSSTPRFLHPTISSANRAAVPPPSAHQRPPAHMAGTDDDVYALIMSLDERLDRALMPPHHLHTGH